MDISPPPRLPTTDSSSPTPPSSAHLAALLADAYRDADSLRKEVSSQRKRAEKAERHLQVLTYDPSSSPGSTSNGSNPDVKHNQAVARLMEDYEERLRQAEAGREEAENRRRVAQDAWDQLDRYLANLELRAKDARSAFTRISTTGNLILPTLPSPTALLSSENHHNMAPPGALPRHSSRQSRAAPVLFPLPPHPNPNPHPTAPSRRPRTPSMDGSFQQPPSKRSRANLDDQRGREPRTAYPESYHPEDRQHRQGHSEARIIDRKYGTPSAHPAGYPQSHHDRGSSASSIDDQIFELASTKDAAPPANGSYYEGPPPLGQVSVRRRSEREEDSPRPTPTSTNPYPSQNPSSTSYPANQSAPGSLRPVQGSQSHVYTTHVFAPVVTGAPTKKSKYPNTVAPGGPGVPGSGPSIDSPQNPSATPAAVPFAATNAQGQRICRQCGMVGRYKDGKCVEKWGPGPMGPGTVCDRCRKKMKRVERRGTLENQHQLQNMAVQQQQYQPRTGSLAQLPLSQGSDRPIQRSDTLLTNQTSHGPLSFNQSRTQRDDDSQHSSQPQSSLRSTTNPSILVSPAKHSSRQAPTPPSIAALREQNDDDDDDHEDPDQLPTSNIGRGTSTAKSRSSSRNGRIATGNGNAGPNGLPNKRSPLAAGVLVGRGSISPRMEMEVDEMDADADADAEAEAEAEILGAIEAAEGDDGDGDGEGEIEGDGDADAELLEAVDAAEANSSSSHGGERSWLKAES